MFYFRVKYLLSAGADSNKLILGIPTYGKTWTTNSQTKSPPFAGSGAGSPGTYTQEPGFLAYYEICNNVNANGWTLVSRSTTIYLLISLIGF